MKQFKSLKDHNLLHHYLGKNTNETQKMYNYLLLEFMPLIKEYFPRHYLLEHRPAWLSNYLDKNAYSHPYFLRFNIKQFYPSITQLDIEPILIDNYEELTKCPAPATMSQYLHLGFDSKFIGDFNFSSTSGLTEDMGIDRRYVCTPCRRSLYENTNFLFMVTATYMLGIYHTLSRWPFLCFHDDFIVLFNSPAEIAECLLLVYLRLQNIGLEIDLNNISSGHVYQDGFVFMGYQYKGNTIGISQVSEKDFRNKIISLTTPGKKYKSQQAFIKQLNHQIKVFGHYFKHAQVAVSFSELDNFIWKRVRKFLFPASNVQNGVTNFPRRSQSFYTELGLCTLASLRRAKETTLRNPSPEIGNVESNTDEFPVFNKAIVEKLLQQILYRYKELRRQEKTVAGLLEHLVPLSKEISKQPGSAFGYF